MPKAKPDSVQVVRFELQERERDIAEGFILGNAAGNLMSGTGAIISGVGTAIGAVLNPFSGAITALGALWIADRSFDEIMNTARTWGEQMKQDIEEQYASEYGDGYTNVCTWLNTMWATGGWEYVMTHTAALRQRCMPPNYCLADNEYMTHQTTFGVDLPNGEWEEVGPMPKFLMVKLMQFLHMYWGYQQGGVWYGPADVELDRIGRDFDGSIIDAWTAFYPFEDFGPHYYYFATGSTNVLNWLGLRKVSTMTWGEVKSQLGAGAW